MSHAGAVPMPSQQLLINAIDSSTVTRLRTVLHDMCSKFPQAFQLACDQLLIQGVSPSQIPGRTAQRPINLEDDEDDDSEDEDESEEDDEDEEDVEEASGSDPRKGQKRGRPFAGQRYEICSQCKEEFDVLQQDICVWHDGELEPDYDGDFWADHDEDCHGTIDSDWCRKEYPEGFMWTCCDTGGNKKGCHETLHKPDRAKSARV